MANKTECKRIKRKVYAFMSVFTALVYTIHIVLKIIYYNMLCDVAFQDSIIIDFVAMGRDVAELLGLSICFGAIIFCIYLDGVKGSIGVFVITGIATVAKNFIGSNSMVTLILGGGVSLKGIFNLTSFIFEVLQIVTLTIIVFSIMNRYRFKKAIIEKGLNKKIQGQSVNNICDVYPFKKIFDIKNPVIASVLGGALVILGYSVINTAVQYLVSALNFWSIIKEEIAEQPLGIVLSLAQHIITDISRCIVGFFAILLVQTIFYEWLYKEKALK